MIVVDTSALLAIVLNEKEAPACSAALEAETEVLMSEATLAEALIVAGGRAREAALAKLVEDFRIKIVAVTPEVAHRVAAIYRRWGKGVHPARLNFGDCFSYELAATSASPLLYIGRDFAQTDIAAALPA